MGVFRGGEQKRWLVRSWSGPIGVLYRDLRGETWVYSVWRVNEKGGLFVPGEVPKVYYVRFLGRDLGVFRVEVNKQSGLFVPGEAPLVHFI